MWRASASPTPSAMPGALPAASRAPLPDASPTFLRDLSRGRLLRLCQDHLDRAGEWATSRAAGCRICCCRWVPHRSATSSARISDAACVSAIGISATNVTTAQMAGAQGSITGTLFDMPAGPTAFALGRGMAFDVRAVCTRHIPQLRRRGRLSMPRFPPGAASRCVEIFGETPHSGPQGPANRPGGEHQRRIRYSDYNLKRRRRGLDLFGRSRLETGRKHHLPRPVSAGHSRAQCRRTVRRPNLELHLLQRSVRQSWRRQPRKAVRRCVTSVWRRECRPQMCSSRAAQGANLTGNVSGGNPNLAAEKSRNPHSRHRDHAAIRARSCPQRRLFQHQREWRHRPVGRWSDQYLQFVLQYAAGREQHLLQGVQTAIPTAAPSRPRSMSRVNLANTVGASRRRRVWISRANMVSDIDWGLLSNQSNFHVNTDWTWTTEYLPRRRSRS